MEIGDFAVVKYTQFSSGTFSFYVDIPSGSLGRIRDATYIEKLSKGRILNEIDLLFVSDVEGFYYSKLKPDGIELLGNYSSTPAKIKQYFDDLKSSVKKAEPAVEKLVERFRVGFDDMLKRALNDYKLLLEADLTGDYPEGDKKKERKMEEDFAKSMEKTKPKFHPRSEHWPLYNRPIN